MTAIWILGVLFSIGLSIYTLQSGKDLSGRLGSAAVMGCAFCLIPFLNILAAAWLIYELTEGDHPSY